MAGGSEIIIDDKGITIRTNGKIIFQAGEHLFEGGKEVKAEIPLLPEVNINKLRYQFTDDDGLPYQNKAYTAYYANGRVVKGITNDEGYTEELFSTTEQEINVELDI